MVAAVSIAFLGYCIFSLKAAVETIVAAVAIAIFGYCIFFLRVTATAAAFRLKGGRFLAFFPHFLLKSNIATMVAAMTLWSSQLLFCLKGSRFFVFFFGCCFFLAAL
jgi:hypothetical protein